MSLAQEDYSQKGIKKRSKAKHPLTASSDLFSRDEPDFLAVLKEDGAASLGRINTSPVLRRGGHRVGGLDSEFLGRESQRGAEGGFLHDRDDTVRLRAVRGKDDSERHFVTARSSSLSWRFRGHATKLVVTRFFQSLFSFQQQKIGGWGD